MATRKTIIAGFESHEEPLNSFYRLADHEKIIGGDFYSVGGDLSNLIYCDGSIGKTPKDYDSKYSFHRLISVDF